MNKQKTLLEAATDMLLNRPQSTVSENISPKVLETLDLLSLHKILDKAIDVVGEKYIEEDDDSEITNSFRVLQSDIDDLLDIIDDGKDNLHSFSSGNRLKVNPNIKEDEALDITGAVLEEISARCESIRKSMKLIPESMKLIVSIEKLCDSILGGSYTDFNSTVMNVEELEEGNSQNAPYGIPYPKFKHDYDGRIGRQELSVIALMNKDDKKTLIKWINDHMNNKYSYYEFDEDLKEGNEELDQIKSVMADISNRLKKNPNKTIKTNFGNVVGMGKTDKGFDYIKFQSQYRGATKDPKIAANDRNSHGYVLKHLTIID